MFDTETRQAALMRFRHVCQIALCGFVLALFVDFAMVPQRIWMMATVRGLVSVGLLALLLTAKRASPAVKPETLSLAFLTTVGLGLIACAVASGADTGYHDTLAVVFLASAVFLSARVRPICAVMTALSLAYAAAMAAYGTVSSSPELLNNVFLLLIADGLAAVFVYGAGVLKSRERQASKREWEANRQLQATVRELDEANSRLKELDEAKNRFFANVNHDLRTPLMLILANIEELKDGTANADNNARQYEITRRNSLRLLRLVDDLLELSRLNSASPALHVANHDLAQLTRELVEHMQSMAARKGIALNYVGCASAMAGIDASSIDRVLNNLITNALKFTPSGGRITVDIIDGDPLSMVVSDTGGGISDADKKHVFDRFYQGASGKKAKVGGVGIGLSLCKRVVDLHGGTIVAEDAVASGTVMRVRLPKQPVGAALATAGPQASEQLATEGRGELTEWDQAIRQDAEYKYGTAQQATERRATLPSPNEDALGSSVLVVEDNFDMQDLISDALRARHKVYLAANGQEGLALARRLRPDVIISDVTMPVMDGFTLLEKARVDAQLRDIPIVLITARGDASDRLTSDQMGADAFIEKPFTNKDICAIVARLVERQRDLGKQAALSNTMSHRVIAAGLAHDIANPLLFLKSSLGLMRKYSRVLANLQADAAKRATAEEDFSQAFLSAENGTQRIQECLSLLRQLHEGQDMAHPVPLNVNYIVERTLAVTAATHNVRPDLKAKALVLLSPGQLDRVLFNLIINAIEAGGPDCPIEVTSCDSEDNRRVWLTVKDGGPGMDSATLGRVTEPYFSTKGRGSGLGLAMCKRIIEDHDGTLTVASTVGTGSHFVIDLPAAPLSQRLLA